MKIPNILGVLEVYIWLFNKKRLFRKPGTALSAKMLFVPPVKVEYLKERVICQ